jgi:hypothetical protein
MDKIMFVIRPHSIVDVITNSSSELFVFEGKEKETIEEIIKDVYPNYLNEYEALKNITELSIQELDTFIQYYCSPGVWPARKKDYPILPGFTFEELYEPDMDYITGEIRIPAWNGELQYRLKRHDKYNFITEDNYIEFINKMSPNKDMYFLFSTDENPDWDKQEQLMNIGARYHLG